jgi:hypothetical protein
MTVLTLPALDGRTPLGFLAALGLTRLLDVHTDDSPRLSWSPEDYTARLHTSRSSIDAVVADLRKIVDSIPTGGVLPGVDPAYPPAKVGTRGPDPMYPPAAQVQNLVLDNKEGSQTKWEGWVSSLVTDLPPKYTGKAKKGYDKAESSLLTAPTGQQTCRSLFSSPLDDVRKYPDALLEALRGWKRYDGVTGQGLDHQAQYEGADIGGPKPTQGSTSRGVPGATWLAVMSFPLFRTTVSGGALVTTGWRVRPSTVFVYPLWSVPLDVHGIVALMEHPEVGIAAPGDTGRKLTALGVIRLCAANRRAGNKSSGVLGPVL